MSVRIICDSTADLNPAIAENIQVIPLTIRFGEQEYIDGVTITKRQFYEKLVECDVLPTTSQITPGVFTQEFQKVVDAGDTAVVMTLATEMSGTYQSAVIAAEDFPGKIFVVDSRSVTIGFGILAEYALSLARQGGRSGNCGSPHRAAETGTGGGSAGHPRIPETGRQNFQSRGLHRHHAVY